MRMRRDARVWGALDASLLLASVPAGCVPRPELFSRYIRKCTDESRRDGGRVAMAIDYSTGIDVPCVVIDALRRDHLALAVYVLILAHADLTDDEIADRTRVTRRQVRAAMRRLEHRGFVVDRRPV
jgi:hypothetical protein